MLAISSFIVSSSVVRCTSQRSCDSYAQRRRRVQSLHTQRMRCSNWGLTFDDFVPSNLVSSSRQKLRLVRTHSSFPRLGRTQQQQQQLVNEHSIVSVTCLGSLRRRRLHKLAASCSHRQVSTTHLVLSQQFATQCGWYKYIDNIKRKAGSTPCLKNVSPLACYNFRTHEWIYFDIFWQKCYR